MARVVTIIAFLFSLSLLTAMPSVASALEVPRTVIQQTQLSAEFIDDFKPCRIDGVQFRRGYALPAGAKIQRYKPVQGDESPDGDIVIDDVISSVRGGRPYLEWVFTASDSCYGLGTDISATFKTAVKYTYPVSIRIRAIQFLHTADETLGRVFGKSWKHSNGRNINVFRCRRGSYVRSVCKVSWWIGDSTYRGEVRLRFLRLGFSLGVRAKVRVKRTNQYCKRVLRKRRCSNVVRRSSKSRVPWDAYDYFSGLENIS